MSTNGVGNGVHGVNGVSKKKSGGVFAKAGNASEWKKKGGPVKPNAKDHAHHISKESKLRRPSPLKELAVHLATPGLISLGGGLPSASYFPFEYISTKVPSVGKWDEEQVKTDGTVLKRGKYDIRDDISEFDLSVSLNYGQGTGSPQLLKFVVEHTEAVHDPPYEDWNCLLSAGNTNALDACFRMLCDRDDYYLCEEYAFPSAIETASPQGLRAIGISMDADGLCSTHLAEVLDGWKPENRDGKKKPNMLYIVPSGQNPTGCTMSLERRKAIYDICCKHDVIIVEDEPYYFLQMEPYTGAHSGESWLPSTHDEFISSLVPSFLRLDSEGRVLRLDSFSKLIAPGTRCGWITGPAQLIERLVRSNEVSIQTVCGFSQTILHQLLDEHWGHSGYLDWLIHIRKEYTQRRDVMLSAMDKYLPTSVARWVNPSAGMFVWVELDFRKHPDYHTKDIMEIEEQIFSRAIGEKVLLVPGSFFAVQDSTRRSNLHFRMTYAAAESDQMTEAIRRFSKAVREEFQLE